MVEEILVEDGKAVGIKTTWHMTPELSHEYLADASRASPGLWVGCLLERHGKETFPCAGHLEQSHRMQRVLH